MDLNTGGNPLSDEAYSLQVEHMISILQEAATAMKASLRDSTFLSLVDRAQFLQSTEERLLVPTMDFVHSLTADLHAAIREAIVRRDRRRTG